MQRGFFGDVNAATARVLAAEGWEVHAPAAPRCCGALQYHEGDHDEARELAQQTIDALNDYDLVVTNAAGCGSAMKEYGHLIGDGRSLAFAEKVRDVTEVLAAEAPRAERNPLAMKVAYHDACHLAHAQGIRQPPRELLRSIPGLELLEPADPEICCGSAGIYNLLQPEAASDLGRRKAERLLATGAEAVAAANPGCTLQITAHTAAQGRELPGLPPRPAAGRVHRRKGSAMSTTTTEGVEVHGAGHDRADEILTPQALAFVAALHREFDARRRQLLERRKERQAALDAGGTFDFRPETADMRDGDWSVAPAPPALECRRVEITGPAAPQDGRQRAELRRRRLHGRLRGLALPRLDQHHRGPAQPARCRARRDWSSARAARTTGSTRRPRRCSYARAAGTSSTGT